MASLQLELSAKEAVEPPEYPMPSLRPASAAAGRSTAEAGRPTTAAGRRSAAAGS